MTRATKSDIRARVFAVLKRQWPKIPLRSIEDSDKAVQPYFAVEVHERPAKKELNLWFYDYTVYVTYNPKVIDIVEESDIADKLEELIGMIFVVKDRCLTVTDWESNLLDKKLLQCQFRIRETVNAVRAEVEPLMEDLDITIKGGSNE